VSGFHPDNWCHATGSHRAVIKLRCMRRTLHSISSEVAPVLHQATVRFRLADARRRYTVLGATESEIRVIKELVLDGVEAGPASSRDLEEVVQEASGMRTDRMRLLVRNVIKELWELGILCYLNLSDRFGREIRRYGSMVLEFPNVDLTSIDEETARRELIAAHVEAYGPVTVGDISWWSGLSPGRVASIVSDLNGSLAQVRLAGFAQHFYVHESHLESMLRGEQTVEPWAEFLGSEDPSLKGYQESRRRYLRDDWASALFNEIGEARPSIVSSGEVLGTWSWDRARRRIRQRLFRRLRKAEESLVRHAGKRLEMFLEEHSDANRA
jgi:hypothetical protein